MQIILQNVCKKYGEKVVFNNLCLTLAHGGAYCLMAPSGFGKTTLLHILCGIITPDSASITGLSGLRPSIVFQEDRLCDHLSAAANLRMIGAAKPAILSIFDELGLHGCMRTPVHELSGGMRRRVALGRALVYGGDIFLFDEPFSGLDHATRDMAAACIKKHTAGKTLIFAAHDETDAAALGAQVLDLARL